MNQLVPGEIGQQSQELHGIRSGWESSKPDRRSSTAKYRAVLSSPRFEGQPVTTLDHGLTDARIAQRGPQPAHRNLDGMLVGALALCEFQQIRSTVKVAIPVTRTMSNSWVRSG